MAEKKVTIPLPVRGWVGKSKRFVFNGRLLYSVLPPTVANELRHGRPVAARRYEMVTLLFSGIVGFRFNEIFSNHIPTASFDAIVLHYSDLCARNSDSNGVMKIVRMLNVLYTTFDVLTDPRKNPNIYKV